MSPSLTVLIKHKNPCSVFFSAPSMNVHQLHTHTHRQSTWRNGISSAFLATLTYLLDTQSLLVKKKRKKQADILTERHVQI